MVVVGESLAASAAGVAGPPRHGEVDLSAQRRALDDHVLRPLQAALALGLLRMLRVDPGLVGEGFDALVGGGALRELRRHLVDVGTVCCFFSPPSPVVVSARVVISLLSCLGEE